MILVTAALYGHSVPPDSRFLVLVVLAFGAAMAAGFLGGDAAANGRIPLPGAVDAPIAVSTAGGVAVLIIVMLVGYYIYVRPALSTRSEVVAVLPSGVPRYFIIDNLTPESVADVAQFRTVGNRQLLYVEFVPGKALGKVVLTYPSDSDNPLKKVVYQVKSSGELTADPSN
ncbi:MAG TPA: hypothetical protein VI756_01225 [Blastocatellia bacterium]